jgi:UDP:flavonoid glycosyltransferase YjiC (YdhE family)
VRFLFTTLAGLGHLHPLVPPARALRNAGHDVRFATAPSLHAHVEAAGFPAVAAGFDRKRDATDPRFVALQSELETLPAEGSARTLFRIRNLFAGLYAERMTDDVLAIVADWRPDVVVREVAEFGGCVAAEALGIPHASVRSNTMLSTFSERHLVRDEMDRLRAAHGLPGDPQVAMVFRYLHLAFEPPRFHDPALPLAPTSHLLRPVDVDPPGADRTPAWIAALPRRPTVYATLGTAFNTRAPGLFEAILEALRDEPVNVVVTVGPDVDPERFGLQPDHVHIERYIPQGLVLPHCDLVITHAGFNTVAAALSHGLPLVALPIDADQPQNARRCVELGLAEIIPAGERTPSAIRDAVRALLDEPSYGRNAAQMRAEIAALDGPEHAVTLLERLARERAPILASEAIQT